MGLPISVPGLGGGGQSKTVAFTVTSGFGMDLGGLAGAVGGAIGSAVGGAMGAAAGAALGMAAGANHEKAKLVLHHPKSTFVDEYIRTGEEIKFQFNPKELSIRKGIEISRQASSKTQLSSPPMFNSSRPITLNIENIIFDDCFDMTTGVNERVEQLLRCCSPTPDGKGVQVVKFVWGNLTSFAGIVKSVNAKYTVFTPNGMPIRAVCSIEIEQADTESGPTNPTSVGVGAHTKVTLTSAHRTLAALAVDHYGSSNLADNWRKIAEANGIDDPMRLPVGSDVLVPDLTAAGGADV